MFVSLVAFQPSNICHFVKSLGPQKYWIQYLGFPKHQAGYLGVIEKYWDGALREIRYGVPPCGLLQNVHLDNKKMGVYR